MSPTSPSLRCPTPARAHPSSPLSADSSDRHALELYDFPQPSIFPAHDPHAAYKKIFCDGPSYHRGDGKLYEAYGIPKDQGAIVVVRPDMYTGLVTGLEDTDVLDAYFGQFMLPAADGGYPGSACGVVQPPAWEEVEVSGAGEARVALPVEVPA